MAARQIRLVAVAIVPLLMGSDAACPPELGYTIFDGTVYSVERASYDCETRVRTQPGPCIEAQGTAKGCTGGDLIVVDGDGVAHSMRAQPPFALAMCDLSAGSYQVTVCTPEGPRTCTAQIDAATGAIVTPSGSLPHHFRYHVRTSSGIERVLDSDRVDLHVGERWRFELPVPAAATLEPCHLRTVPPPAAAHGCGHCDAGEPDLPAVLLVMFVLLSRRGRLHARLPTRVHRAERRAENCMAAVARSAANILRSLGERRASFPPLTLDALTDRNRRRRIPSDCSCERGDSNPAETTRNSHESRGLAIVSTGYGFRSSGG